MRYQTTILIHIRQILLVFSELEGDSCFPKLKPRPLFKVFINAVCVNSRRATKHYKPESQEHHVNKCLFSTSVSRQKGKYIMKNDRPFIDIQRNVLPLKGWIPCS